MGCAYSDRGPNDLLEQNILVPLENEIGFNKNSAEYIFNVFSRHASEGRFSVVKFKLSCCDLSIEPRQFSDIFNKFIESDLAYDLKRLTTLGILLGSGPNTEKIKFLFNNYDRNTQLTLEKKEIVGMLHDIFVISCICLPFYALKKFSENNELKIYASKLKSFSKLLADHFSKKILEKDEEITMHQFCERCLDEEIINIVCPSKLRSYSSKVIDSGKKFAEMQQINEPSIEDKRKSNLRVKKRNTVAFVKFADESEKDTQDLMQLPNLEKATSDVRDLKLKGSPEKQKLMNRKTVRTNFTTKEDISIDKMYKLNQNGLI